MARIAQIERCPTGIPGFDILCQGGLVRGSINLLLGGPGAGKTTFLMQFLWNGITEYNENGLFISLESDTIDILQDAVCYGWDFSKFDQQGKCKLIRFSPKETINDMKGELTRLISKYDIRRVVIDQVGLLAMAVEKEKDVRGMIFDLVSLLKRLKVTVVFSDEISEGAIEGLNIMQERRTDFTKFIADALINLHSLGIGGQADRAARIIKMRRTNHIREPVPMEITGNGIIVRKLR